MKYILVLLGCLVFTAGNTQTLFTYGNEKITVEEFTRAYKKSQTGTEPVDPKQYLDLYIASKLKVKEARQRRYDTLPQIIAELEQLRSQITPSYINDEAGVERMIQEAFNRSQKDLNIAHIFIALRPDSIAAKEKLSAALKELSRGEPFKAVAAKYSDDPSAATNGGDLGFVTVFTLPYELENVAWQTASGQISKPHRSAAGFHILKVTGERKALGRMKAAQILLAFPPDATKPVRDAVKSRADSIFGLLMKGADFGKLAELYSNDVVSAASQGVIPEFGVGEYDPVFERQVFSISTDNSIVGPFETAHGWHIVKRLGITPPPAALDEETRRQLREKIETSDRIVALRKATIDKISKLVPHKMGIFKPTELWSFSDSTFNQLSPKGSRSLNAGTVLFTTKGDKTMVAEWLNFAQVNRFKRDGSGILTLPEVWKDFLSHRSYDYYSHHLEDFNPAFKVQLDEFREGNLFFEIMQREVWEKAQNDTVALKNYFNKNKAKYNWKASADAVIFTANDPETAKEARETLVKTLNWKQVARDFSNRVITDSSRIEIDLIPNESKEVLKNNSVTGTVSSDGAYSFAYIIKTYPNSEPRTFSEAKGLVINDYQAELDKAWVEKLRKKYPVVINQKVWIDLQKKLKN